MSSFPARPAALSALLLAGTVTLSSCAAFSDAGAAGDGSSDGTVTVAAAFYPLEYVASRVAGDRAVVEGLTSPGQEAHDAELSIQQTATLAEADLTVFLDGFQPTVDAAVEEGTGGAVLEVGETVGLRQLGEAHSEDDGHDHAAGDLDPHFWLDPMKMADLADAVAEELSAVDAEGAEEYAANAADLRAELEQLDADYASGLASCERDLVVVNHDAFGYLTKYGLELEAIAGLSPDSEPTAADVARLQDLIEDEGVTTVFSETLVSPETAETLARDAGVEADVLDPIEGLTDTTADEDYLSLMRANLEALRAANGC
ncbi:MAG: metal ABC transporter substrate-binding protein [Nocardioides sp.]|jgi:zinc transport system substrate-binding protein|uniref:metal ABC transporter substrate-binding protein n=1 Tax=Nocardioides sp. TaxID=35761 RepID=UPI0026313D04|nr:metal ABC transporter substrate-binding protein [Nocardioides sp.]